MTEPPQRFTETLITAIYSVFLSGSMDATTRLYILTKQLARAYNEKTELGRLEKIWEGGKDGIPLPSIEIILLRDLNSELKINKTYNYGYGKIYTYGELNRHLQRAKEEILAAFFRIYSKRNPDARIMLPIYQVQGPQRGIEV